MSIKNLFKKFQKDFFSKHLTFWVLVVSVFFIIIYATIKTYMYGPWKGQIIIYFLKIVLVVFILYGIYKLLIYTDKSK